MLDKPEVRITPKQQQVFEFICAFHAQKNGMVPTLKELAVHLGFTHSQSVSNFITKLVDKGLLRRFETRRGYYLPDDRPTYVVSNYYVPPGRIQNDTKGEARQQTTANDSLPGSQTGEVKPADEFQYIRLAPGEAATIGELYIGVVDIEDDKRVAALEVIAPASLGVLRRDVRSDLDQAQQPGPNEILLRCMEKTIELMGTEIYRLREAGTQSAGRREA
ncbi:LexA family protein [Gimesia algae]|uniref:LexA repressor n=1 Tax=Gimesia algae TaxID=2527971 RepID=A0A517VMP9_9PLAN|nr:hypothetical protein [Gimesia algae]QDT94301.1 LexA repressor [Gimesia algae]